MADSVHVRFKRLSSHARVPQVMQAGDVAADVYAADELVVPARGRAVVPLDLALDLPVGFRARLFGRSGLGATHGLDVGAGLIDQGYHGNISVLVFNHSEEPFAIAIGDRIAQLAVERTTLPHFVEVERFDRNGRTEGWGSSGLR